MTRLVSTLSLGLLVALVNFAAWWWPNQVQQVQPLPDGRLQSVSFAPFRDGQSPLARIYPTAEQIAEDMRVVARQAAGIRTYTSREGLEVVPALARALELTVTAGAWIGREPVLNEAEIQSLIRQANAYPDVIRRVIVGNEVLLRRDQPVEALVQHIRRVKAEVSQPVGYADVWENFERFPALAAEVDYLVIHILPYWEDIPAGLTSIEDHILWAYRQVKTQWPDKPVMIGETGWPTAGRSRGPAEPGRVNKAAFLGRFAALAEREGFDYNIIEAFDQSWKERLEGTVGANWGLLSSQRTQKFPLDGRVVEDPSWWRSAIASTAVAAVLLLVVFMGKGVPPLPGWFGLLSMAALAQLMGSALVIAARIAWSQNFVIHQIVEAWTLVALQLLVAVGVLFAVMRHLSEGTPRPSPLMHGGKGMGETGKASLFARVGTAALWGMALWTSYAALAIFWDGRYRNFPLPDLVVPAVGILVLAMVRWRSAPTWWAGISVGHLMTGTWAQGTKDRRRLGEAVRAAPLATIVAVTLSVGLVGVAIREVWLQGLGLDAVLRVSREVGFGTLAGNGLNIEALATVLLMAIIVLPFWAMLAHLRAGARVPEPRAEAASADARGWDSR